MLTLTTYSICQGLSLTKFVPYWTSMVEGVWSITGTPQILSGRSWKIEKTLALISPASSPAWSSRVWLKGDIC